MEQMNETYTLEEALSDIAVKEINAIDSLEVGSKERNESIRNVINAFDLIVNSTKYGNEQISRINNLEFEKEKFSRECELKQQEMKEKLEQLIYEREQREIELAEKDAEIKLRNRQLQLDLIKLGVEAGMFLGSAILTTTMLTKACIFETEGSFRTTFSRETLKLYDNFIRKLNR